MKSPFFFKTKQLGLSVKSGDTTGILVMTLVTCALVLIALSGSVIEKGHFDRDHSDLVIASRLAEEILRSEVEKTLDAAAGPDDITQFCAEKKIIPGPPDGGPRIVVIVRWKSRAGEKQVYLVRSIDPDILTAAHLP